jgi:hypothetical protein
MFDNKQNQREEIYIRKIKVALHSMFIMQLYIFWICLDFFIPSSNPWLI